MLAAACAILRKFGYPECLEREARTRRRCRLQIHEGADERDDQVWIVRLFNHTASAWADLRLPTSSTEEHHQALEHFFEAVGLLTLASPENQGVSVASDIMTGLRLSFGEWVRGHDSETRLLCISSPVTSATATNSEHAFEPKSKGRHHPAQAHQARPTPLEPPATEESGRHTMRQPTSSTGHVAQHAHHRPPTPLEPAATDEAVRHHTMRQITSSTGHIAQDAHHHRPRPLRLVAQSPERPRIERDALQADPFWHGPDADE